MIPIDACFECTMVGVEYYAYEAYSVLFEPMPLDAFCPNYEVGVSRGEFGLTVWAEKKTDDDDMDLP